MTIQFQCGACQQTLAVPDEIAGKKAKCPNCAAVLDVPTAPAAQPLASPGAAAAQGAAAAGAAAPSFGPTNDNPYGAPAAQPAPDYVSRHFSKGSLDAGLALSTAWKLFQANAGVLIGATLLSMVISFVVGQINQFITLMVAGAADGAPGAGFFIVFAVLQIVGMIINSFFLIGLIRICIGIGRNERVEFGMLFSGMPYLLSFLLVYMGFTFLTTIGFLLLIAPGVYLMLTYWPAVMISIDRKESFSKSFGLAGEVASGNRLESFLMVLIMFGVTLLGAMACGVGLIVALPLVYQMFACGYLMMTNQKFDGNLS